MKRVVGVIGPIGSGKDVVGEYIAKHLDAPVYQISSPLREIRAERGVDPTRQSLIVLGSELGRQHGDGYLAEYLLERAPQVCVITGMRQLGQISYLRKHSDFTLIAVDAEPEVRFQRTQTRAKLGESGTLAEFIQHEKEENSAPNLQCLFECIKLADSSLSNDGSLDELYAQADELLAQLGR